MPWGYHSADYDEDGNLIGETWTRYEDDGSVNRYTDNGDGGHSHSHWKSADDYNAGEDPDQHRSESNRSRNPETPREGCFLTTACLKHYEKKEFSDNCFELEVLRRFRDEFVPKKDIAKYYKIAPKIVEKIGALPQTEQDKIYSYIYKNVVYKSIFFIAKNKPIDAYNVYKNNTIYLAKKFNVIQEKEASLAQ